MKKNEVVPVTKKDRERDRQQNVRAASWIIGLANKRVKAERITNC